MKKIFFILVPFIIVTIFLWRITENSNARHRTIVAIQPFEHVDRNIIDSVVSAIKHTYSFDVVVLPAIGIPGNAFVNSKSPRYRAEKLIAYLKKIKPDSVDYIMGITIEDISTTKLDESGNIKKPEGKYEDWGIMGLGYCPGKSSVVSTFRLNTNDAELFSERIKKVAVHEMGHNLSLPHCPEPGCVMNSANESIKTVDREKMSLCAKCRKKLNDL